MSGVGVYFACMHTVKTTVFGGSPTPTQSLIVGAGARTLAGCIMIPVTVVKIRYLKNVCLVLSPKVSSDHREPLPSGEPPNPAGFKPAAPKPYRATLYPQI